VNPCDKGYWRMRNGKAMQVETIYLGSHPSWDAAIAAYWGKEYPPGRSPPKGPAKPMNN
jgi:hypothetical protein